MSRLNAMDYFLRKWLAKTYGPPGSLMDHHLQVSHKLKEVTGINKKSQPLKMKSTDCFRNELMKDLFKTTTVRSTEQYPSLRMLS